MSVSPGVRFHIPIDILPPSDSRFSLPYSGYMHLVLVQTQCNDQSSPYLAKTMGSVFKASLSMIGVCGLFFFIVG